MPSTKTSTESETLPSPSSTTYTYTYTLSHTKRRKRGAQKFEQTHERLTIWLDNKLKRRFEALADEHGVAKSTLLNEAISDLLTKYEHPEGILTPAHFQEMEQEILRLQHCLNSEERFRTDTQVHPFKKWLRTHDHPQDTDFFKRFLADGHLPERASRGLYEAKMRSAGYSDEDMHLFQDAWKTMLYTQE